MMAFHRRRWLLVSLLPESLPEGDGLSTYRGGGAAAGGCGSAGSAIRLPPTSSTHLLGFTSLSLSLSLSLYMYIYIYIYTHLYAM